jgi:hypothetical protein
MRGWHKVQKKVFDTGVDFLVRSFPEKQVDYALLWNFLSDLTDEQFMTAIKQVILLDKEIYKSTNLVAVIREKALKQDFLAADAWGEVIAQIRSVGSWGQPVFKNKVIEQAVNLMGWKELCMSENQIADRAHFLKIFETLMTRENKETIISNQNLIGQEKVKELLKSAMPKGSK